MPSTSGVIVRNSAFGMAAQITVKALSFTFTILIVRRLGETAFGQYAAVLAFVAVFAIISDLGLGPYMVREVARLRDVPKGHERINLLFTNILLLRLVLSVVALILASTTVWLLGQPVLMVGAVSLSASGLFLYSVQGASEAMLTGFERLDIAAGARVVAQLVFVTVGGAALILHGSFFGLIVANLLSIAFMAYICWRAVRRLGVAKARIIVSHWPQLLRCALPFGIIGFTLGLSYKFDTILLSYFRGDAETGFYNAVYNLVFSAVILSNVLNTTFYPTLTRLATREPGSLPKMYARALRYLMLLSLPITIAAWVLADQLVLFLFKATFLPAVPALQIVIWVVPLMFATEFLGYVVVISGRESYVARAITISTSINLMLNFLLVPIFGFIGAAVMTVVTEIVLVSQYAWTLRSLLQQLSWGSILVRPLVAASLMGLLMFAFRHVPLALNVACGVISYSTFLIILGVIGQDELKLIRSLRRTAEVQVPL